MTETISVKALKKQLAAAIAMVCVAAVALGKSLSHIFGTSDELLFPRLLV